MGCLIDGDSKTSIKEIMYLSEVWVDLLSLKTTTM